MSTAASTNGRLVAFVGIDGSGKTTQASLLAQWLRATGRPVTTVPNPSLRPLRRELDRVAREAGVPDHVALIGADTARLVAAAVKFMTWHSAIEAHAGRGAFVLVDRWVVSQIAAGRAQGALNESLVRRLLAGLPQPDVTFLLDIAPEVAQRRVAGRGHDTETLGFLTRLREAYASLPEAGTFVRIDAAAPIPEVHEDVRKALVGALPEVAIAVGSPA